jgi:hypothetical protein
MVSIVGKAATKVAVLMYSYLQLDLQVWCDLALLPSIDVGQIAAGPV